jgi:hypothetical protein
MRHDAFANPNHHIDRLMFVAQGMNYDKVMALKRNIDAAIGPSGLNVLYVMWQAERMKVICDHLNITLTIIVARPRRLSVSAVFLPHTRTRQGLVPGRASCEYYYQHQTVSQASR